MSRRLSLHEEVTELRSAIEAMAVALREAWVVDADHFAAAANALVRLKTSSGYLRVAAIRAGRWKLAAIVGWVGLLVVAAVVALSEVTP